jgi:lysophospholipase L1-like esterase
MAADSRRRLRMPSMCDLALLFISLLVACVGAEFLVRIIEPQQLIIERPDIWQPRDTVGYDHRPNVRTTVNTGEGTVHFRSDSEGFRVARTGRVESKRQVLLIGDSFMEALQVEYEQSMAGLLERDLSRRFGQPIAVRNAGVGGWDPPQYLARTRDLLSTHRYDLIVVVLYLGNDVVSWRRRILAPREANPPKRFRLPHRLGWGEVVDALFAPINDYLEARSHLYIFFKNHTQLIRTQLGLAPRFVPREALRAEASAPRWRITTQLCSDLAGVAAFAKTPVLFVLLPEPFQVDTSILVQHRRVYHIAADAIEPNQANRLLGDSLRARGLTVVDALPGLRAAHATGVQLYGRVDHHFSAAGHAVVARLLEPIMVRDLIDRGVPTPPADTLSLSTISPTASVRAAPLASSQRR